MGARINRWVYRVVGVCAVLAALAFHHNHTTRPCSADQVGAGGMCVSTSLEMTR
ncbi:hypothetical protein [Micromonospora sp. RTGN7]|uniref:hypothetical protein n=1 Tax=Micromonospora sp. RTGN7 TaxID=3016526 RepID=UPI0029FEE1CA|nr:hypothetical protein [Micromonospora sp. RTGN7]